MLVWGEARVGTGTLARPVERSSTRSATNPSPCRIGTTSGASFCAPARSFTIPLQFFTNLYAPPPPHPGLLQPESESRLSKSPLDREGFSLPQEDQMAANVRCLRTASAFLNLATTIRQGLALTTALLLATSGFAEQTPQTTQPTQTTSQDAVASAKTAPEAATVTVPAGTRIALVLTQPVQTRYIHLGDDIYAQTTSPVTAGNEVVIPPGTFVQGKVDNLERQSGRGELHLQSMSLTFPDGYVAPASGPLTLESPDGYAIKDPGKGRAIGGFALPAAGLGLGALIGHSLASSQPNTITSTLPPGCTGPPPGCLSSSVTAPGSTAKDTVIGAMVGGAVGAVASLALLFNTHNFFLDVGSPVEVVLQQPLSLQQDQVADAVRQSEQHPAPEQPIVQRPQPPTPPPDTDPGICYTPGTPGTPDVDIPGTPATDGSPGTPPIHIPGMPATPPTPHPCP